MATITVRGNSVSPERRSVARRERVTWVGPPSAIIKIAFGRRTPVEWQSREEDPGVPVRGTIKASASGAYPYRAGNSKLLAGPELIVDGGLTTKRKTGKKTAARKTTVAKKKAGAKKKAAKKR